MNKKTFCLLLGNYYEQVRGGAEYQAYLLAAELLKKGYDVHYIFIDNGMSFDKKLNIHLHPVKRGIFSKKYFANYSFILDAPKILSILEAINPDIIYQRIGTAHTGIAAYYAVKKRKCSVWHIALENDLLPAKYNLKNILRGVLFEKRIIRYGINHVGAIIAQADYQNNLLEKNYDRTCDAIIPNFHPLPSEHPTKQKDVINVAWVANIKPHKRPLDFVKLAEAIENIQHVKFYMAGRVSSRYGEDVAVRAGQQPNLSFLGEITQDEVNQLLEKSHVFVNTSEYEGFPNTFIQAWLRKVPVLSLNIDPDGILSKERIGICSHTMESMVVDCRKLIENQELWSAMSEAAYNYAIRNHTLDANIEKILSIISVCQDRVEE